MKISKVVCYDGVGDVVASHTSGFREPSMPTPHESLYSLIPLTRGQFAMVDPADFDRLNEDKWKALWNKDIQNFYAYRTAVVDGHRTVVYMHREVMGLVRGDRRYVDHINHQSLDNRRQNLRIVTNEQNGRNTRRKRNNSSGFIGVSFCKKRETWRADITVNRKHIVLGHSKSIEAAVALRREAEQMYFGEFSYRRPPA